MYHRIILVSALLALVAPTVEAQTRSPTFPRRHASPPVSVVSSAASNSLFAAVAATIADSAAAIATHLFGNAVTPVRIEPRSLRTADADRAPAAEAALDQTGKPILAGISKQELAERQRILAATGIASDDITSLDACPGSMATIQELEQCPKQPVIIAAFGIVNTSDAEAVVRVVVIGSAPPRVALSMEYVMRRDPAKWRLLRQGQMLIVE